MGRSTFTRAAYTEVRRVVETTGGGRATHAGEERQRKGLGLDPLVDPAGHGVIRRSLRRFEIIAKGHLRLTKGLPMNVETLLDTTGSMGGNVQLAFDALPELYDLLAGGQQAVLARYDTQITTSIFGDVVDSYVLQRSQAEMDEKIAKQMTLMVPEGQGGDGPEDPEAGLFGAAYLTHCTVNAYGLKRYHFTVTDAPTHGSVTLETLERVFGKEVMAKVAENDLIRLPENRFPEIVKGKIFKTGALVADLLREAHAFLIAVGGGCRQHWKQSYGEERIVTIPTTEFLPHVQAAIIGLTEGLITLRGVKKFLQTQGKLSERDAESIAEEVAGIPIGAQAKLRNFSKIPLEGAIFEKRQHLWPIGHELFAKNEGLDAGEGADPAKKKKKKDEVEWA
jgi:hypothetical protein